MSNVLTIKFDKHVGLVERTHQLTGAKYIYFFTPNENGIEFTNAGLGEFLITGNTTYTWEPEPIVIPPPLTYKNYRVINPNGMNLRNEPTTSSNIVGSVKSGDVIQIENDGQVVFGNYKWGRLINTTDWVAMKSGTTNWVEVITVSGLREERNNGNT